MGEWKGEHLISTVCVMSGGEVRRVEAEHVMPPERNKTLDGRRDQVRALFATRMPINKIAAALGVTYHKVRYDLQVLGLTQKKET